MRSDYILGIDAGGSKVAYGLFGPDGDMMDRTQHATDAAADGEAFSETLLSNIRAMLGRNRLTEDRLAGIGICMPSFILFEEGSILMTSAMPNIKRFPIREYFSKRLKAPVVIDNDSNAAALAEYRRGAGRGCRHMVYVTVGTGLGSGIIIDGKLFRGSYGWAGECGHMLSTPDEGFLCGCENRGCFMSYASGRSVAARICGQSSYCAGSALTPGTTDGASLLAAYQAGDALAIAILDDMARHMGICIFNVYQMLNIKDFVFGGGLSNLGEPLFSRVRATFDRYNHIPMPVEFKIAELGSDIGLIGAAEFVREGY